MLGRYIDDDYKNDGISIIFPCDKITTEYKVKEVFQKDQDKIVRNILHQKKHGKLWLQFRYDKCVLDDRLILYIAKGMTNLREVYDLTEDECYVE